MKQNAARHQPDLFDVEERQTAPIPAPRQHLVGLVEALLREIAAALVSGEAGDDQDHV
jgi:hypothetical protein